MSILTNVSDNTGDYKALILNHFLLGWQFNNIPVINNKEVDVALDLMESSPGSHQYVLVMMDWDYLPMLTE